MPQEIQLDPPGSAGTQTPWTQQAAAAAAAITLTQAATAGKTNFCTGIMVTGGGATAGSIITITLQSGGTTIATFKFGVPTGAAVGATPLVITFDTPLAGLAQNQNMVLNVPSFGAGNTDAAATMTGFVQ